MSKINSDFVDAEDRIRKIFFKGARFFFGGEELTCLGAFKPQTSSGEPKTDIYIKAVNSLGEIREIKLSYKKANAEFLENKASKLRAETILGKKCETLLILKARELNIADRALYNETNDSYVVGYRLDIMSGPAKGYAAVELTFEQIVDVYSGHNLPEDKRHAKVDGEIIVNSGVAEFIIVGEGFSTAQEVVDRMQPITEYVKEHPNVYIAFKAVNYFAARDKWDGNRPLALRVIWKKNSEGTPEGKVDLSKVYATTCNPAVEALKNLL